MKLDIPKLLQHDRLAHDFYPTPVDVTQALLDRMKPETKAESWIEPACGDGDISMVLEANGCDVQSFDLRPDCYGVGGIDYLNTPMQANCIITNPPFSLAPEFIDKACGEARIVCMLLKSNFWHASSRASLFAKRTPALILPLLWRPAFLAFARGKSPFMDVCWNVWHANMGDEEATAYIPLARPKGMPRLPLEYHINQLTRCLEAEHGRT